MGQHSENIDFNGRCFAEIRCTVQYDLMHISPEYTSTPHAELLGCYWDYFVCTQQRMPEIGSFLTEGKIPDKHSKVVLIFRSEFHLGIRRKCSVKNFPLHFLTQYATIQLLPSIALCRLPDL